MDMVKIQTENVESDVQEKYKSTIFKNRILQKFEPNNENILLVLGTYVPKCNRIAKKIDLEVEMLHKKAMKH